MFSDSSALVDPGTVFSVAGLLYVVSATIAGIHVVLHKRNEAAAFSWLGIIVLSPFFGVALYWLFGINRIRRRAQAELTQRDAGRQPGIPSANPALFSEVSEHWRGLMRQGLAIHNGNYLAGNSLTPLINGDAAYPRMLQAIDSASLSVVLSSYIFAYDAIGKRFVEALVAAHQRGVQVRVLIDGFGVGYGLSLVRSDRVLRRHGVATARFLSAWSTTGTRFINLRNHRKILSVDGRVAFVGGLNIRANNLLNASSGNHTQDVHFLVEGPVINQINGVFSEDWQFAAGESLELPRFESELAGSVTSRVLLDGPDVNYQKLQLTMMAAINAARRNIRIVTPYFLPDGTLINALQLAVLRGVCVELLVPDKNNLKFVDWAMRANESKLLDYGITIYRSKPPFDHSKLFLVDEEWSLIGSSNWDSRSLELNFEINLECYDRAFNRELVELFDSRLQQAAAVTGKRDQQLIVRLRNNFFRLFSPYL